MRSLFIRIPIYRLVLGYLVVLLCAASLLMMSGLLPYRLDNLAFSTVLIAAACWASNWIFSSVFGAVSNFESVCITALILALIVTPVAPIDLRGVGFVIFASTWAMASKYVFAIGKRHFFNPAAFGVAIAGLGLDRSASWWIGGNPLLLPLVIAGGLLIAGRLRSFDLVASFGATALVTDAVMSGGVQHSVMRIAAHSMFFFFVFVMMTEPRTAPLGRVRRLVFGAIVGILFAPSTHFGPFFFTPEVALVTGNIAIYLGTPRRWPRGVSLTFWRTRDALFRRTAQKSSG